MKKETVKKTFWIVSIGVIIFALILGILIALWTWANGDPWKFG